MSTRCFAGPQQAVSTASDLTSARKDKAIYKGLRSVDKKTGRAHPQRGFVVTTCNRGTKSAERMVTAAQSYDLLNSVTRGKYYVNPLLEGAGPQAKYESWGAGLMSQEYDSQFYPAPLTGYTGLPTTCNPENCAWIDTTTYPSYTIDHPTGLSGGGGILVERCIPPPGAKRVSPWHAQAKVAFRNTNAYWGAVNAQPLQGMRFRAPLSLARQTPSLKPGPKNWVPSGSSSASAPQLFCLGKSDIN